MEQWAAYLSERSGVSGEDRMIEDRMIEDRINKDFSNMDPQGIVGYHERVT